MTNRIGISLVNRGIAAEMCPHTHLHEHIPRRHAIKDYALIRPFSMGVLELQSEG